MGSIPTGSTNDIIGCMKHPIVVSSQGRTEISVPHGFLNGGSLSQIYLELQRMSLRPTRLYLNVQDYDDIVRWGK